MEYRYFNNLAILDKFHEDELPGLYKQLQFILLERFIDESNKNITEYKIRFKKEYWNEYRIYSEIEKCYCCSWYELNGRRYSYIGFKEHLQKIELYDLVLEVEALK